jgi:hypothetical protein
MAAQQPPQGSQEFVHTLSERLGQRKCSESFAITVSAAPAAM